MPFFSRSGSLTRSKKNGLGMRKCVSHGSLSSLSEGGSESFRPASCMKVKTLEESISECFEEPIKGGEDSMQESTDSTVSTVSSSSRSTTTSTATPPSSGGGSMRRNVSFSSIDVHSHLVTLGDNPSACDGPPLTLDWKQLKTEKYDVEEYEHARRSSLSRDSEDLLLPGWQRASMLRENGVPKRKIVKMAKKMEEIQKSREAEVEIAMAEYYNDQPPTF